MNDHAALAALLRSDLRYFVWKRFQTILPGTPYLPNWHIDAIVYQLMRMQAGDISRLLINQPPRSLKSICVSVAYVAWLLGHDPTRRVIVVSYSNEFAAELHRQFRMVIDAPWYRALFPAMRPARDSGTELVTTAGGSRYATSVGGTLTGRGADLIVVDDPLKAEEAMSEQARKRVIDWYAGTLVSRLNDKENGPIIVVMQRLHENDLAGHLLGQGGWEHLDLPAIAVDDCLIALGHGKMMARRSVTSSIRSARAKMLWIVSRRRSAACSSQPSTSNGPFLSKAISFGESGSGTMTTCPKIQPSASCRVGTSP